MLVLAKLENAESLTSVELVDINALLKDLTRAYQDYATSNAVSIKLALPAQTLTLKGDRFLLHQAVGNLIKNAIEHAHPQTQITVSAYAADKSIQITVNNIGEPIPDYAIDKLFERFYSLPNRKGHKGSGIGLSFVREVAKLHSGRALISNEKPAVVSALITLSTAGKPHALD